jgi:hypothetical protein
VDLEAKNNPETIDTRAVVCIYLYFRLCLNLALSKYHVLLKGIPIRKLRDGFRRGFAIF